LFLSPSPPRSPSHLYCWHDFLEGIRRLHSLVSVGFWSYIVITRCEKKFFLTSRCATCGLIYQVSTACIVLFIIAIPNNVSFLTFLCPCKVLYVCCMYRRFRLSSCVVGPFSFELFFIGSSWRATHHPDVLPFFFNSFRAFVVSVSPGGGQSWCRKFYVDIVVGEWSLTKACRYLK
jgi:hypothetical protein